VEDVDQLTVFPNALQMTNLDCSLKRINQLNLMKNAFNPGNPKYGINVSVKSRVFKSKTANKSYEFKFKNIRKKRGQNTTSVYFKILQFLK